MCRGCIGTLIVNQLVTGFDPLRPTRRNFMATAAGAAAAVTVLRPRSGFAADGGADVIFRNGVVIPMAGSKRSVEALAIGGGKIIAVGGEAEVMGLKTPSTRIVDLAGRTLLPGFIDPHHHTCGAALFAELLADVGYSRYPTRAEFTAALKALADKTPAGEWILAYDFDNLLQGGDLSMKELDAISTSHPIFVWYINAHDGAANAMAFEVAKIPADVGVLPGGGHFGRGPDGKFDGLIYEESALLKILAPAAPKITPELVAKAILDYTKTTAAVGNTTLHEPGTIKPEWIEGLTKLSNVASVRLSASLMVDALKAGDAYRSMGIGPKATMFPDSRFSLYGIKIIGDGSNQTLTGAQTKPYLGSTSKGSPNYPPAELKTLVAEAKAAGWPIMIHCNGDATIDDALDAIEAAYGWRQSADRAQSHRARDHVAGGPDRPDEGARGGAQLPDEPRLSLWRGLSRPDFWTRAGRVHGSGGRLRQGGRALHLAHRRALFADWPLAVDPDGGDAPLRFRQVDHRRRSGDHGRAGA